VYQCVEHTFSIEPNHSIVRSEEKFIIPLNLFVQWECCDLEGMNKKIRRVFGEFDMQQFELFDNLGMKSF